MRLRRSSSRFRWWRSFHFLDAAPSEAHIDLMAETRSVYLAWSGGKDSSITLRLLKEDGIEVRGLLTTLSGPERRISMHGVPESLLDEQADALGLPILKVALPDNASDETYRKFMTEATARIQSEGVDTIAFGDIFLEDLREWREQQLAGAGMQALFPLWKMHTGDLAIRFLGEGFQAVVTSLDASKLPTEMLGRFYDEDFLHDLPDGVDPCGENGEFHTFVFAGPVFERMVAFRSGEVRQATAPFVYLDVFPKHER